MINIRKLENELWEAADLFRVDSKIKSQKYCMPVWGLIFLRYSYSRFKFVEAKSLKNILQIPYHESLKLLACFWRVSG